MDHVFRVLRFGLMDVIPNQPIQGVHFFGSIRGWGRVVGEILMERKIGIFFAGCIIVFVLAMWFMTGGKNDIEKMLKWMFG